MTTVVAIAGGTASGKSTLCRGLAEHLGDRANVLLHDRYYRTVPAELAETWNYDEPSSLETDLMVRHVDALRRGQPVEVPCYDFAVHGRLERRERLEPREFLLVEGILVLTDPALRERFDVSVFVHVPADIRLARRLLRDMSERGREPRGIIARYQSTVRPMHEAWVEPSRVHADHVFDGTRAPAELLADLLSRLGER